MRKLIIAATALCCASSSQAETLIGDNGFSTLNEATVAASPEDVWAVLIEPSAYWNPDHGYSGMAEAFSLNPAAGGCFCETLPNGGSVEHMRVVLVIPNRMLRLSGALGPLQSEGLAGALTWELTPQDGGTRIRQMYAVGGHMAFETATIAPAVDGVVGEQLQRLAAVFDAETE